MSKYRWALLKVVYKALLFILSLYLIAAVDQAALGVCLLFWTVIA